MCPNMSGFYRCSLEASLQLNILEGYSQMYWHSWLSTVTWPRFHAGYIYGSKARKYAGTIIELPSWKHWKFTIFWGLKQNYHHIRWEKLHHPIKSQSFPHEILLLGYKSLVNLQKHEKPPGRVADPGHTQFGAIGQGG
jgi:hypothetical protein